MKPTAKRVFIGRATKDHKSGLSGAVAFVDVDGKYPKRYEIRTRGMNQAKLQQAIVELEEKHEAKEVKVDELQGIVGVEIGTGGAAFTVAAAILRDRGTNVELYVQLTRAGVLGVAGVISKVYRDAGSVPTSVGVLQLVEAFADSAAVADNERDELAVGVELFLNARSGKVKE